MSSANVAASLSFLALCTLFAVDAAGQAESAEPTVENSASLVEAIGARCVVAMHLERESSGIAHRLAELVPSAVILDEPGERVNGDC